MTGPDAAHGSFFTTRWSLILRARDEDAPGATAALERLCRGYWYPLYAFLRRQGCPPDDAQDAVQEFFSQLIEKSTLQSVVPERGRFRSFLMTGVKNVWLHSLEKARAQKRGGGAVTFSLDALEPEARYAAEPADPAESAERMCDRRWAEALVEQVLVRLEEEFTAAGNADRWVLLRRFLTSSRDLSGLAEIAAQLGMTEPGVKSAILRLRKRQAEIFREEVERTVADPAEAEEEMRHLLMILSA
jgi:RNA polymerase sigma-70 factor (ECF subfamily)